MRISVIGSGRVAFHLVKALGQQHDIINIYSRNEQHAEKLATQFHSIACTQFEKMDSNIDLLIIAVSDQAISDVIQNLAMHFKDVLIVHTSGSTHLSVLTEHHSRSGVFYPLQTFSLERDVDWQSTPLFVEAVDSHDLELLQQLAEGLSRRVYLYDSKQRLSLHLAAVFACNFTNYCYDMAKQVVDAQHVDFSLLYPLMLETAKKATEYDPTKVQTGPAMRGDQNILNMHSQMLEHEQKTELKLVYDLLSEQIFKRHQSS